ncbi:MAG TPA: hypothetical protein VD865_07195 [Stenotrophomonas sp.]|nr:hypothetical protein [Stenotrophomonas sp.]
MSRLTVITDRALERALDLASTAGDGLRHAGSNLRHQVAPHAVDWIKTGAALGAVKTGGKVATRFARRNPVVTVAAAAAGVGLIAYALYRKKKGRSQVTVDGSAERLEQGNASARRSAQQQYRGQDTDSSDQAGA